MLFHPPFFAAPTSVPAWTSEKSILFVLNYLAKVVSTVRLGCQTAKQKFAVLKFFAGSMYIIRIKFGKFLKKKKKKKEMFICTRLQT